MTLRPIRTRILRTLDPMPSVLRQLADFVQDVNEHLDDADYRVLNADNPSSVVNNITTIENNITNIDNRVTVLEGSSGRVLWKWNETDLSQFDAASIVTPNAGTIALGLKTSDAEGNRIEITTSGFNGTGYFRLLDDDGDVQVFPRRYVIRCRVHVLGDAAQPGVEGILARANQQTGTDLNGIHLPMRSYGNLDLIESGAGSSSGAALASESSPTTPGTLKEWLVSGEPGPTGASPEIAIFGRHQRAGVAQTLHGVAHDSASFAYSVSWEDDQPTVIALGAFRFTSGTISGTAEISDLEILKHPMDE